MSRYTNKIFEEFDILSEDSRLTESEYWGINAKSRASGLEGAETWGGKYIAFTSKDEASRCREAIDERGGKINNFITYTLTDLSDVDSDRLLIFDTYEEYKEYTDNDLRDRNAKEEELHSKQAKVRDDIIDRIANDLEGSGFNVLDVGEDAYRVEHKSSNDVDIRPSIYCDILIDVGVSYNGSSYGCCKYEVNSEGLISRSDYSDYKTYDEYRDKIIKDVKEMSDRCERGR